MGWAFEDATPLLPLVVMIWWLLFFSAVGLCIGSFLNVVIHRLPLGLSIRTPTWSFCPHCKNRILWYDNLPVVGYLRLGGRCRFCWNSIAMRYPVVELMMGTLTILLFDAFFIEQVREGLVQTFDLNARVAEDWPIFLAHIILFASLLAMSATDMECYWIDIRYTYFAAAAGVILHAIWTPIHSDAWLRPAETTAAICCVAFGVFAVTWVAMFFLWRPPDEASFEEGKYPTDNNTDADPVQAEAEHPDSGQAEAEQNESGRTESGQIETGQTETGQTESEPVVSDAPRSSCGGLLLPIGVFAVLLIGSTMAEIGALDGRTYWIRAGLPLALFLGILLREASQSRESDTEVMDAIEAEAPGVRRYTLIELGMLLPAIIAGVATLWYCMTYENSNSEIGSLLQWTPRAGTWRPMLGVATAITGYTIAAAIGWFVRILANLVFGREAFATGDIHMMAAAGAVLGWEVVLLGFVVTCFLAMFGWLLLLPFKRSRAIPLGPWLTLGLLTTVIFYQPIVHSETVKNVAAMVNFLEHQWRSGTLG